jgi:hypothetical protein
LAKSLWTFLEAEENTDGCALHDAARHLNAQRERKQRLVEAFVYQPAIDESTHLEQADKLNEAIALAEINERDTRIEEADVQAAVGSGVHFAQRSAIVGAVVTGTKAAIAASDLSPWGAI